MTIRIEGTRDRDVPSGRVGGIATLKGRRPRSRETVPDRRGAADDTIAARLSMLVPARSRNGTMISSGVAFNVQAIFTAHFGPQIDDFMEVVEGSDLIAILAFLPWGWLVPVIFAATGIVLWRTRTVPRWSAGLLVAAGVLFIASRPARVDALAVVGDCVTILAMVPIGWSILARVREATPVPAPAPAA